MAPVIKDIQTKSIGKDTLLYAWQVSVITLPVYDAIVAGMRKHGQNAIDYSLDSILLNAMNDLD